MVCRDVKPPCVLGRHLPLHARPAGRVDVVFDGIGEDNYRRSFATLKRGGLLSPTATRRACSRSVACAPRPGHPARVAERISFDEVAEAHRRLEAGGLQGKLVLCPDLKL